MRPRPTAPSPLGVLQAVLQCLLPRGLNLPQDLVVVAHALLDPHRRHRLGRLRSQDADRVNARSDGRGGASWGVLKRNAVLGLEPELPHGGKVGLRVRLVMGLLVGNDEQVELIGHPYPSKEHLCVGSRCVGDGGTLEPRLLDPRHQLPQALHGLDLRPSKIAEVLLLVDDPLFLLRVGQVGQEVP